MSSSDERVPALDGIRGIAVVLVIFHHCIRTIALQAFVPGRLITIGESFHIGVDLFFVLSGYLITSILIRERGSRNYYSAFYWRRCLRILPLYFLILGFVALALPSELSSSDLPWYLFFLTNVFIVTHGYIRGVVETYWSLALEEQFYAVWPVINRYLRPARFAAGAMLLLCLQPVFRTVWPAHFYFNPLTHLDGLLAGSLLAMMWRKLKPFFESRSLSLLWVSIGYLTLRALFAELRYYSDLSFFVVFDFFLVSICFATIIGSVLVRNGEIMSRILGSKFLQVSGKYSYSMYLVHSVVCFYLVQAGTILHVSSPVLSAATTLAWTGVVWAISCGIAALTWRYIEAPLLKFKDRVGYSPKAKDLQLQSAY